MPSPLTLPVPYGQHKPPLGARRRRRDALHDWTMAEAAGATLHDAGAGPAVAGALGVGDARVPTPYGWGLALPGTSAGVLSFAGYGLGQVSLTVAALCRPLVAAQTTMFCTRDGANDQSPTLLVNAPGHLLFALDTSGNLVGALGGSVIIGRWHMLVGTYSQGTGSYAGVWSVYIDGVLAAQNNFPNSPLAAPPIFSGATWYCGWSPQFNDASAMQVAALTIWPRALTPGELRQLSLAPFGAY